MPLKVTEGFGAIFREYLIVAAVSATLGVIYTIVTLWLVGKI